MVKMTAQLEANLTSVERIKEYWTTPQEVCDDRLKYLKKYLSVLTLTNFKRLIGLFQIKDREKGGPN
jgi:hypothetical protein